MKLELDFFDSRDFQSLPLEPYNSALSMKLKMEEEEKESEEKSGYTALRPVQSVEFSTTRQTNKISSIIAGNSRLALRGCSAASPNPK